MTIDVERARAETPGCEHRVHFNSCGASLMPECVIQSQHEHLDLEATIGGYEAADAARDRIEACYGAIARMLGCRPDEVAVVENATRAWDMAFYGLEFGPGDRILTSVAEYASNYIAFLQVARRTGATVEAVPNDESGALCLDSLRALVDDRVKLIAITHVPTNGGLVNPAPGVGAIAREHAIPFLLDACQSAGQMALDVETLGVDFLSATSRKFLRGPRGSGFLYVRRRWLEALEPPFLDLHAARWTAPDRYELRPDARRFENWECNVAAKIGLGVAVEYALQWGLDAIATRIDALATRLRRQLAEIPGVVVLDEGRVQCGIVSFRPGRADPRQLVAGLRERGINASVSSAHSTLLDMRQRALESLVRAGVHYFNTEDEVDVFVGAVAELAR